MVYISACTTDDSGEARRVYRQTKDNLPEHIEDTAFWLDTAFGTGYYVEYTAGPAPVEFINDHWYHLSHNPRDNTYWTNDHEQIDHNDKGTGYWLTINPQHSDHKQLLTSLSPTDPGAIRESSEPIAKEEPYLPSLWFTTPPDTELEYLDEPTARDTVHAEILTTALDQIASF